MTDLASEEELTAVRSLLFAPASNERMVSKALVSDADAIILDLEDAVTVDKREQARAIVASTRRHPEGPLVTVRVNHPSAGVLTEDVHAAVSAQPAAIMLPKAELPEEALVLARELDRAEKEAGLLPGSIAIIPLIESGLGLHHCYDIAKASPRVRGLAFSSGEEGDFMADIDGQWSPDGAAMLYPRSKIVCENRAAGLVWVIDGVFMGFRDDEAFERECRASRRMGFQAKLAIHPQQIATIHQVFSPTPEEIARASVLVAHYRDAESKGIGAISINGMMVDKANVEKAKRTLAAARRNKE